MDTQESSITYVVNPAIHPYHLAIKESPKWSISQFLCFYQSPLYSHTFIFLLFLSYRSTADYQCCDSFRGTAKGLSHAYPCTHSPWHSPSNKATTSHGAEFPVLYSRSLLVIHFKYSSYTYVLNQNNFLLSSKFIQCGLFCVYCQGFLCVCTQRRHRVEQSVSAKSNVEMTEAVTLPPPHLIWTLTANPGSHQCVYNDYVIHRNMIEHNS